MPPVPRKQSRKKFLVFRKRFFQSRKKSVFPRGKRLDRLRTWQSFVMSARPSHSAKRAERKFSFPKTLFRKISQKFGKKRFSCVKRPGNRLPDGVAELLCKRRPSHSAKAKEIYFFRKRFFFAKVGKSDFSRKTTLEIDCG